MMLILAVFCAISKISQLDVQSFAFTKCHIAGNMYICIHSSRKMFMLFFFKHTVHIMNKMQTTLELSFVENAIV